MECFSPVTWCLGTIPQTVPVTVRKTLRSPGFWKYSQWRHHHVSRESRIFSTQTMRSDFDLFLAFFGSWPLPNHLIGILLSHFGNVTFKYHLLAPPTKLHTPDTSRSDTMCRYVGALRRFSILCCFFWIFRRSNFRAFFTIFLQLTTANSDNRCSTASFPYINANTSSKVYIYQVIASRYTYKLQKQFIYVSCVHFM